MLIRRITRPATEYRRSIAPYDMKTVKEVQKETVLCTFFILTALLLPVNPLPSYSSALPRKKPPLPRFYKSVPRVFKAERRESRPQRSRRRGRKSSCRPNSFKTHAGRRQNPNTTGVTRRACRAPLCARPHSPGGSAPSSRGKAAPRSAAYR